MSHETIERLQTALLRVDTFDNIGALLTTCLRVMQLSNEISALVEDLLDENITQEHFKAMLMNIIEREGA